MASGVREPAVAGSFYPAERGEVLAQLKKFFNKTKRISNKKIKALIVPHAGWVYSGQTAAWGFKQLEGQTVKRFILLGPSHHHRFSGLLSSSSKDWLTPLGTVKQKPLQQFPVNDLVHTQEHCLEVQLPFLQYLFKNFQVSCLLAGEETELQLPADSVLIVSSDLSHYLTQEEAQAYDQKTIKAILSGNRQYLREHEDCACGRIGILILMGLAKQNHWQAKLICYDTSLTASGDASRVVGYAAMAFYE